MLGTKTNFITHGFQAAVSKTQALFFCQVSRVSFIQQMNEASKLSYCKNFEVISQLNDIIAKVNSALHLKSATSVTRWTTLLNGGREDNDVWVSYLGLPISKEAVAMYPNNSPWEQQKSISDKLGIGKIKKSKNGTQSFLG